MSQQNTLAWNDMNVVYGDGTPTYVSRELHARVAARPWTPEQLPLVQGIWEGYQHAIDNFRCQMDEYGHDDVNGLVWACGKVFGVANKYGV